MSVQFSQRGGEVQKVQVPCMKMKVKELKRRHQEQKYQQYQKEVKVFTHQKLADQGHWKKCLNNKEKKKETLQNI
jgi:hypothetical protein